MQSSAKISPCGTYRYLLTRQWNNAPVLPFVMLNPSTANAEEDDPTIRRCIAFAKREKAGGIVVANQFAFRATDPRVLESVLDPFGPENETALAGIGAYAFRHDMPIVCSWGSRGSNDEKFMAPLRIFAARLVCLGLTKSEMPRHPLYVRDDQPLVPFLGG